jgi:hypothetical protein
MLITNDIFVLRGTRVVHFGIFGPSDAVGPEKRGTPCPYLYGANAIILTPQWTRTICMQ